MTLKTFLTSDFTLISLRYALDWILVIGFTVAATFLGAMDGARRPFNPYDQDYSYPYGEDTVSVLMMGIVAIAGPALIILLTCFFIPKSALPALADRKNVPTSVVWKHRLLNWNRAWLGLGLTSALAFFISNTLKNVIGKPRPNMIAVCDVNWAKVAEFVEKDRTGPMGILSWNPIMRAEDICQQTDNHLLAEAFRSFPSGHATMAFSGMTYMSLFFYSTLVLTLRKHSVSKLPFSNSDLKRDDNASTSSARTRVSKLHPPSLPLVTFVVVICFFCLAMWIACTRYLDFKHAGIDLLAGALLGFSSAICGTWWYALPAAGGVGKGRIRAGYREIERKGEDIPLEDYDHEPRGPLGAGERVSLGERASLREGQDRYEDHQLKHQSPPPENVRPVTAVSHV